MDRVNSTLCALMLSLAADAAGAGGWGTATYRTALLSAAAPTADTARFVPLDGFRAAPAPGATIGLAAAAAAHPELALLSAALNTAAARSLLAVDAPRTLLAPTDAAFAAALSAPQAAAVQRDPALLLALLRAHLMEGRLTAKELAERDQVTTLDGQVRAVDRRHGMHLGGGRVILADVAAGGGVIHLMDDVLSFPRPETSPFSR